ncbi:efflux RND transporter permease subunit [Aporhodopirellula aestuarii]|uniref:Efflux RND transporter permease subunit n=1 Tax=Aporhodopirellula aestuarii TaxID=2950107 RepID=A0ABT0TZ45_9BACT|nr:efflux RND transporter permease subunit [Aporhodopirellula aestuarii]MCM2369822.1 efflux RND transporter permease subunit [Aporhodopirellula aestuarii]
MIRWFTINGIAANFLMLAIIVAGSYVALTQVPLEVTPALSWNTVMIEMEYRGGTAKDVERAILIPVEAALEGVDGIESLNADGHRGGAKFFLRASRGTDLRNLMDDVKARLDTITTFPAETEPPRVMIPESASKFDILQIAVMGELSPYDMRAVARRVQQDLLEMPGISRVDIRGEKLSEVSIEAHVDKLLAYNLSFQDLADAIRGFSLDLPAGAIDSDSGTFIVRTRGQAYSEAEFENIPIRSAAGAEVRLGEVATIRDGFVEDDQKMFFNGKPAVFVPVMRVGDESALGISNRVREYIRTVRTRFPEGIELEIWDDESLTIRHRLSTLAWSLLQGGLFVLLILGLFIRPALAFWIVIGIPVSFAGAALFMPWFDLTANVMSLFGFIIVTGIVVDDAIVTGENVYSKIMEGIDPLEAAIEGTSEVATPVTFGALTTVVAFLPLMFFDGTWGDYARQVPPVVAPVLLFSLIESKLILPAHLKHLRRKTGNGLLMRIQAATALGLERVIASVYQPSLRFAVQNRLSVIAGFVALALLMAGYCVGGRVGFVAFPSVDNTRISAQLDLPDDTPLEVTEHYVDRISDALDELKSEFVDPGTGESLVQNVVRLTGARRPGSNFDKSRGYMAFEILPPEQRTVPGPKNSVLASRWSELVGEIPEARRFETRSESAIVRDSEYSDEDLNIELRGPASPEKKQVARDIKELLDGYSELKDQWAKIIDGQDELEISLKPRAAELGLTQSALASQIRQAFFGEEAQRLQRGVDDIRVMVRLPLEARQSLHTLDRLKIRTPRGAEVPLETVANVNLTKAPSFVERNDRAEIIRLGAQPVDEAVDVVGISKELAPKIEAMCIEHGLSYQFLGYVAEAEETKRQTIIGSVLLMLTLYGLLAIALKSLIQPIYVLLAVPFAIIGALVGHILMDLTPSYLSIFGMLALAGIAVNDTLVMVDFINRRQASGVSLLDAALEAGGKRFRPIFLTSITTFVGLLPLMLDDSIQAQFLIPMAVSLAFGVLFATAITLYMVPCAVVVGADVGRVLTSAAKWYWSPVATQKPASETIDGSRETA